jgi:thiol-disulfide isomerase/thioredoxin
VTYDARYFELYCEPGDSIHLNFDAEVYPYDIAFSGIGAAHNTLLYQYRNAFSAISNKVLVQKINSTSGLDFRKFMDTELNKRWDFYSNFSSKDKENSSSDFKHFIQSEINYWYAYTLMRYRDAHSSVVASENVYLPDAYFDFLNEIPINDDDAFIHPNYSKFLKLYYSFRMEFPDFPHGLAARQQIIRAQEDKTPMYLNIECIEQTSMVNTDQKLLVLDKYSYNHTNRGIPMAYRLKVKTQDGRVGWMKAYQLTMENNTASINHKTLFVNNLEVEYLKKYLDCAIVFDSLCVYADPHETRCLMFLKKEDKVDLLNETTSFNVSFFNKGQYYSSPLSKVRTAMGFIGWVADAGIKTEYKQKAVSEWQSQIAPNAQTPLWGLDYFFSGKALYYVAGLEMREKILYNGKNYVAKSFKHYINTCKNDDLKAEITQFFNTEDKIYQIDSAQSKRNEIIIDQRATSLNKNTTPYVLAKDDAVSPYQNTSVTVGGTMQQENTIASLEKGLANIIKLKKVVNKKKTNKKEVLREPQFPEVKFEFKTASFKGAKKLLRKYQFEIALYPDLVNKMEKNPVHIVFPGKKMWSADTFQYNINLIEPVAGFIKTKNDSIAIWIEPGQHFNVLEEDGKIKLVGEGCNAFSFIKKIQAFNAQIEAETQKNIRLSSADFKAFLAKKLKEKKDFLIDNNVIKKLPLNYYKTVDFDNEYWYYNHLLDYPTAHPTMDLIGYYDFIRDIKIQNERALQSVEYQKFIHKYLDKQIAINAHLNVPDHEIARSTYSSRILKYWEASAIAQKISQDGLDENSVMEIQKYADDSSFPMLNESLKTSYYKQSLKKSGYKIPVFQVMSIRNYAIKSSEFKNKVVLIHFWSSKHKNYKSELNDLDKAEKRLNNPNVIFLKVNTDKNIADWRKVAKKYKNDRYHVFGNEVNTYSENIYRFFDLNSNAATKIVMDKKGSFSHHIKSQFTENELLITLRNEIAKR